MGVPTTCAHPAQPPNAAPGATRTVGADLSPPIVRELDNIPVPVLGGNLQRVYLEIVNEHGVDIRLGFGRAPQQGQGVIVEAGTTRVWEGDHVPTGTVYAVADCDPNAHTEGLSYPVTCVQGSASG